MKNLQLSTWCKALVLFLFLVSVPKPSQSQPDPQPNISFSFLANAIQPANGTIINIVYPDTVAQVTISARGLATAFGGSYGQTFYVRSVLHFYVQNADGTFPDEPTSDSDPETITINAPSSNTGNGQATGETNTGNLNQPSASALGPGTYKIEYEMVPFVPGLAPGSISPTFIQPGLITNVFTVQAAVIAPPTGGGGGPRGG